MELYYQAGGHFCWQSRGFFCFPSPASINNTTQRYAFPICPVSSFSSPYSSPLQVLLLLITTVWKRQKKTHKPFSFGCKDSFTSSFFSLLYKLLCFVPIVCISFWSLNKLLVTITFIYCQAFVLFHFPNYYFLLSCAIVRYTPYSTHLHCFVLVRSSLVYALFHLTLT